MIFRPSAEGASSPRPASPRWWPVAPVVAVGIALGTAAAVSQATEPPPSGPATLGPLKTARAAAVTPRLQLARAGEDGAAAAPPAAAGRPTEPAEEGVAPSEQATRSGDEPTDRPTATSGQPGEAAAATADGPEESDYAAAVLPAVTVRSGRHDGFERFVFDWPSAVPFTIERRPTLAVVHFAEPAAFAPTASVPAARLQVHSPTKVAIGAVATMRLEFFTLADHRVVIDIFAEEGSDLGQKRRNLPAANPEEPASEPSAAGESNSEQPTASLPPPLPPPGGSGGGMVLDGDDDSLVPLGLLRRELYRRDLMVASLLARLEAVERGGPGRRGAAAPPPPSISGRTNGDGVQATAAGNGVTPPLVASAWSGRTAPASDGAQLPPDQAPPDQAPADQAAVERALERTLTRAGALLLRPGEIEIEPALSYTRRETSDPVFVTSGDAGVVFIGENEVERDEVTASLDVKAGLPFDSQIELTLPFNYVDQSVETTVGGVAGDVSDGSAQGIGNPRIGVAKTLLRESGWRPDIVARAYWDTKLGKEDDDGVALTGDFDEIGFSFSATKRQDPLAFVGAVGYATVFENNDIQPGDTLSLTAAAVLAASPSTSLRLGFTQQFSDEVEVDGEKLVGSDSSSGVLTIGASSVLGRRALLDVALDVGLNDDAPDYALRLSVPVRFDLPTGWSNSAP